MGYFTINGNILFLSFVTDNIFTGLDNNSDTVGILEETRFPCPSETPRFSYNIHKVSSLKPCY